MIQLSFLPVSFPGNKSFTFWFAKLFPFGIKTIDYKLTMAKKHANLPDVVAVIRFWLNAKFISP